MKENNPLNNFQKIIYEEKQIIIPERHTLIRESRINAIECGANFEIDTSLGIKVFTDSEKLAKEVDLALKNFSTKDDAGVEFIYLTKNKIPKFDEFEIQPRPISVGILGDLVVDKNLTQYCISGPDKFGSLESVLFGIYSFERAEKGFLGLHAAQIYDNKKRVSHILIGNSGIGKSTVSQLFQNNNPGRFTVLSDDWVEIDPSLEYVEPVSTTLSSHEGSVTNDLNEENRRVSDKFTSFGKNFYTYDVLKNPNNRLGSIILMLDKNNKNETTSLREYFIDSSRHIPFIDQISLKGAVLPIKIKSRLDNIISGFDRLAKNKSFHTVISEKDDMYKNLFNVSKFL